jgi:TRAP-type C4-dicarboxylate transport system substrate-binding protein
MREFAANVTSRAPALAPEVEADITPAGMTVRSLLDSVERGERQICYVASSYLSQRVPGLSIADLPFSVSDRAHAFAALDSRAGQILSNAVAGATGFVVLGFWDNGFRHISNGIGPIRSVDDCAGMTIRTLDNLLYQRTFAAMGFIPKVTDPGELQQAVASGRIQAQENPLTNLLTFELYRHHRHVSLTGHLFGLALLLGHGEWLRSLTPSQRETVHAAANEATEAQRASAAEADIVDAASLVGLGVEIVAPPLLDLQSFRSACRRVRAGAEAMLDPNLLDAYCGSL